MHIKLLELSGIYSSLHALRLPMKSSHKSDSFGDVKMEFTENTIQYGTNGDLTFGEDDLNLARRLVLNGDEHAKAIRGIIVWTEIDAPRLMWQEIDTYTIGTDPLGSESTMHTILKDDLNYDCYEQPLIQDKEFIEIYNDIIWKNIKDINKIKTSKLTDNEKIVLIKHILYESFKQKRIRTFSYQTLRRLYFQRRNHRLEYWRTICKFIESLPFSKELITVERKKLGVNDEV